MEKKFWRNQKNRRAKSFSTIESYPPCTVEEPEQWTALTGNSKQFELDGNIINVSQELDTCFRYKDLFKQSAQYYANRFEFRYHQCVKDYDTLLHYFEDIYMEGLAPMLERAYSSISCFWCLLIFPPGGAELPVRRSLAARCPPGCSRSDLRTARRQLAPPLGRPLLHRAGAAKSLVPYLVEHHYTHVEFLPLAEYPFDGSWGYQGCGYFAPTQRIGGFAGFAALVDALHAAGIAVLMDFVPVHFAPDADRLACFDGAPLFESGPSDWGSLNFDLASPPVRSFLLSSAAFWLQVCRCDGLRVDAIGNALYTAPTAGRQQSFSKR